MHIPAHRTAIQQQVHIVPGGTINHENLVLEMTGVWAYMFDYIVMVHTYKYTAILRAMHCTQRNDTTCQCRLAIGCEISVYFFTRVSCTNKKVYTTASVIIANHVEIQTQNIQATTVPYCIKQIEQLYSALLQVHRTECHQRS